MRGGLDPVKDEETLTDQSFCPLLPRPEAVMSALDRMEKETDKGAFYAVNVTAGIDQILKRAEMEVKHGAIMMIIDAHRPLETLPEPGSSRPCA